MDKNKRHTIEICSAFMRLRTINEARLFLEDILTPQEFKSVTERLQIFKLLAKGLPQRNISRTLKVSISKVSRGARAWRVSKGGIGSVMKRMGMIS